MQLTRTFEYLWTVRDSRGQVLHRNTSRDEARAWRDNTRNHSLQLFRQQVSLAAPEVYVKG